MRSVPVLIAAAVLLGATLSGCATTAGAAGGGCEGAATTGRSSEAVTARGDVGDLPVIDFPTPLKVTETQRTVIDEGDGARLVDGSPVDVRFTILNGTTGEIEQQSGYAAGEAAGLLTVGPATIPGVADGLLCASAGSRVAIVVPPSELSATAGAQTGDDSIVFVIDVVDAYLPKADGAPQAQQNGFPSVVTAPDGTPGITLPPSDPPAGLRIAESKSGSGPAVAEDDTVIAAYTGMVWSQDTTTPFDSSWDRGAPATFDLSQEDAVIPGFREALVGAKVGSQVVAIIPPSEGYGENGNQQAGIGPDSTLVFVIDVLGVK